MICVKQLITLLLKLLLITVVLRCTKLFVLPKCITFTISPYNPGPGQNPRMADPGPGHNPRMADPGPGHNLVIWAPAKNPIPASYCIREM